MTINPEGWGQLEAVISVGTVVDAAVVSLD
jgi:hypothetical protein